MDVITDFVKIMELKRYSKQTISSYKGHLLMVKTHFKSKSFNSISDEELFEFIYHLVTTKKFSASNQRQIVGSLKLFYKELFNRDIPFQYLKVTQRENSLPVVLSKNEVFWIIENTNNLKHKTMISLIYSAGLRIGNLLALKKEDIDSERMLIHIRNAKGKKDRYTILSQKAHLLLREYYKKYTPAFIFLKVKREANIPQKAPVSFLNEPQKKQIF